jgi:hypothetical protein
MVRASGSGLMPIWPPSGPMSRTSLARILSLIRGSVLLLLVAGDAAIADHSSCVALVLLRKFDIWSKNDRRAPEKPTPVLGATPGRTSRTSTRAHTKSA